MTKCDKYPANQKTGNQQGEKASIVHFGWTICDRALNWELTKLLRGGFALLYIFLKIFIASYP